MKRNIAFILLFATVLSLFVACADTPAEDTNPEITTSAVDETTEAVVTEDPDYLDNLPELNYNGEKIRVVSSARDWYKDEVSVENICGEIVSDAVYNRNLHVSERLGIEIENILIPFVDNASVINAVSKVVSTNDDVYDISFIASYRACIASTSGVFFNLKNVENLDLTKKYWLQSYNEAVSYRDAQFTATGAIALSTMKFSFATFFNKKMFDDRSVEYPYKAVSEGKWTLEHMLTLLPTFYVDNDGDQAPSEADTYSWIANDYIGTDPFWVGCEIPIMTKNADGVYQYSIDTQKLSDTVDKLLLLYLNSGTRIFAHASNDSEQSEMSKAFAEGKGAMASFRLIEAESAAMRDMTDKYGVVPMPKYDENQVGYHTQSHDQYSVVSVVSTVTSDKRSMMGAFLEAMAYQSYKEAVPAYYEVTLKLRYSSDPETWEMLDIVINNIKCEAGNLYYSAIGAPHDGLRQVIQGKTNSVATRYKAIAKTCPKQITRLNEDLDKLIQNQK